MWKWLSGWTSHCRSEKSHLASGVACVGARLCDVLGDYTTSSNDDIIADADGHDGRIRTDAHAIADGGLFPLGLITTGGATNPKWIVDEHRTVTDEAVFANGHEFANEGVALHARTCANRYPTLDFHKGSNKHTVTQRATVEVDGFDQCDVLAELNVDDAVLVDSGLAHGEGGVNLSLEWVGCIMLKACRGKPGLMSGDGVEIEYRFFIPDPAVLPPLGKGIKIVQCYLPKWKIELVGDNLCFDGRNLVRNLPMDVNRQLSALIEDAKITPRIRLAGDSAFVTVKGPGSHERVEHEFEVMVEDVQDLVTSFRFPHVLKTRYEVPADDGLVWEIDFFEADNHGLVMAELEVPSADYEFVRPDWLGQDVTEDGRFGNGSLARDPWCDFCDEVGALRVSN